MMKLNFKKGNGLIPTVVIDTQKELLVLAYSNQLSLKKTLKTGLAHYFSRSKRMVWQKGEDNGNIQQVVHIKYDCDKDALLFVVKQKGAACHTGKYSCFHNSLL